MTPAANRRVALLVGAAHERTSGTDPVPSVVKDLAMMSDRLAEYDAGFDVRVLDAGPRLPEKLDGALAATATADLILYFSGRFPDAATLALEGRGDDRLELSAIRGRLRARTGATCVVIDAVHPRADDDPIASATFVAELRDAMGPAATGATLLVGARASSGGSLPGPSLFTRLLLSAVEGLVTRGAPVNAKSVFSAMREDEDRFIEIPASGCFEGTGARLSWTAHESESSPPSSVPLSSRAPRKPPREAPEPAAARGDESPPSSGPLSSRAPRKPPSGSLQAVRLQPTVPSCIALGDEHFAAARFDPAVAEYKKALMMLGSSAPAERATLHVKIGTSRLRAGSEREASSSFEKALALDPGHAAAFDAAAALLRNRADFASLERLLRRKLEAATGPDDKAAVLMEIAAVWLEEAGDSSRGEEVLEKALALRPDDATILTRLADAQAKNGRPARTVATLRRLAQVLPELAARGRVLADAAALASASLPNKADAIDLARASLDADPTSLVALEVAARELGAVRRWRDLAAVYLRSIEAARDPVVAHDLAKKLGRIHRDELDDVEGSLVAFQRAATFDPNDVELRYWLAELHESAGSLEDATRQFQRAAAAAPTSADIHRRALWLFERRGMKDAAWRAAAVLDELEEADINESLLANQHRPEGLLPVTGGLAEEDWLEGLFLPERDDDVNAVLAAVAPAAIAWRATTASAPSLHASTLLDLASSTTTLARSAVWTAKLLGVPEPQVHVLAELDVPIAALAVQRPTSVVSKALGTGLGISELAFLWGRSLPMHRDELRLLVFFPTLRDLGVLFLAALSVGGEDAEPSSVEGDVSRVRDGLTELLADDDLALLRHAVHRFDPARARRRVRAWMNGARRMCSRAGLLACGDLGLASALTRRFPQDQESDVEELAADLLAYSITDEYGTLRRRLGVSLG